MKSRPRRCLRILVAAFLLVLIPVVTSQNESYTLEELQAMTDGELEELCVKRGFELVEPEMDPTTGETYTFTHDDFVEAAQRCLTIEAEMNELLESYPDLAEELEEEIRKMEEEQAVKRAEIEDLQQQLEDAETGASDDTVSSGAAFVTAAQRGMEEPFEMKDDETIEVQSTGEPINDPDLLVEATEEDDIVEARSSDIDSNVDGNAAESTTQSQEIASTWSEEGSEKDDFTMSVLAVEMLRVFTKHLKQAQKDLKKIMELILPAFEPLLKAGNKALETVKTMMLSMKSAYESSKEPEEEDGGDYEEVT